jgi:hypothetical protein
MLFHDKSRAAQKRFSTVDTSSVPARAKSVSLNHPTGISLSLLDQPANSGFAVRLEFASG